MSMIIKTLGNFECTVLLGRGGMGEVYRARDLKLGRDVAIKVLPEGVAVSIETEPTLKAGKPETLFRGNYTWMWLTDIHPWDISPDGKRFLMMKPAGAGALETPIPRKIDIVLNWFKELKERVPAE